MNSVKALLRLELKAKIGSLNLKDTRNFIKYIIIAVFSLFVYGVYIYGARSFLISFYIYDMQYLFLVLFTGLVELILIFAGIGTMVKSLFFSGDNEILLRFPVKGSEVFVSKILLVLITESIVTLVLILPVYITYGIITGEGAGFYLIMPLILLFNILLPFILSNIFAIPFMFIQSFLKNKYTALLIIFIAFVAGGFAVYMLSVQGLLAFMEEEAMDFFSNNFMVILSNITNYAFPFRQFVNVLTGRDVLLSLALSLLLFTALSLIALIIVKKMYLMTMLKNIEASGSCFERSTKNIKRNHFNTIIRREFLEIFRSTNYSFQYLAMAFGAPIMVYFCNRLAAYIGKTNVGQGVLPSLTMLVMLIFISLIVSFASSAISREGDNFYITKIAPVSYVLIVTVKLTLYLVVAFSSIIVSLMILMILKYIVPLTGIIMLFSCMLLAVGETCLSIKLDIKRPTFAVGGDGDLTQGTPASFLSLFIGLMIAMIIGASGMVLNYFIKINFTMLIVLAFSFVFAGLAVFLLYYKLDTAYKQIISR
jgi:ABC-2 type transport system permease protein